MMKRAFLLGSSSLALMLALPGHAAAGEAQEPRDLGFWPPPFMRDAAPTADRMIGADAPDVLPDEIVVDFKDNVSDEEIAAVANDVHIALADNSPGIKDDGKIAIGHVGAGQSVDAIMDRLAADPHVEGVERA